MQRFHRILISTLLFPVLAVTQNTNTAGASPQTTSKKSPSKGLTISPNGVATDTRAIHNSALVIDTHADTPGRFVDENFDLSQDAGTGYLDFDKI
jgi:membrane dipeptidase